MISKYIIAIIVGILTGILSCFFAQGGISRYKLFIRLTKAKGKWHRYRAIIILSHVALSIYGLYLYDISVTFFEFMLTCSYLIAMTSTDIRNRQVPDDATIFYAVVFTLLKVSTLDIYVILNSAIAVIAAAILPFIAYLVKRDSIGFGDIKLIACISIAIGFPNIIFVLAKGFFAGGIYAAYMLFRKKVKRDTELPMVPFILIGAIV